MFGLIAAASAAILDVHGERAFVRWMRGHSLDYVGAEYFFRLGVFLTTRRFVREFNPTHAMQLSLNHFAALTPSERHSLFSRCPAHSSLRHLIQLDAPAGAPDSLDWRKTAGVVNPIKFQGPEWGPGWAFAAIQAQESQWALSGHGLLILSESNLLDCVEYGGSGRFAYDGYDWAIERQGGHFVRQDDYPEPVGACAFDPSKAVTAIVGYRLCGFGNETLMAQMCAQYGPLTAALDADTLDFQLYKSDVYQHETCSRGQQNHELGIVGYGTEGNSPFWILRNSWGTGWGEARYMRFWRGANLCGIAQLVLVPQIAW
jgi:C1A family cysteine protease